jgi:radical SAM protein (TIGR01212 family)
MAERYNRYSTFIKKKFGSRVQKVSLDGGFTCPNRDGTKGVGGCCYCNNESFSPALKSSLPSISEQLEKHISILERRYRGVDKFIAYFQPYSNTYAPLPRLKELYEEALSHPKVIGLSLGTRPDCVTAECLDYLEELAKSSFVTIEYGLESASNDTLNRINRCHDLQCFVDAVEKTADRGIYIGTHLILGFPWESRKDWYGAADVLSDLPIDFLKIHQLHVVKNTLLAKEYRKKPFHLLEEMEYLDVLLGFITRLDSRIVVQRLFSEAPDKYLVSRNWVNSVSEWNGRFETLLEQRDSWQGKERE